MHRVQTNAELEAIHAAGVGFVFNDFTSGAASGKDNVLHVASCPWVRRMLLRAEPQCRPSVRKIFFASINEARSWLAANRGQERCGWKRCDTCRPDHARTGEALGPRASGLLPTAPDASGWSAQMSQAAPASSPGSWPAYAAFAMPDSQPLPLPVAPRLASWNAAGDSDQVRLAEYLAIVDGLISPRLAGLSGPFALRLDVGLPRSAALLDQRDLDNYLDPLARRISRTIPDVLACVWGTKQHAPSSYVRIEQAVPAPGPPPFDCCYIVRTSASSQSPAFKEQIRDQLSTAIPLPPGPVQLQLCFTVGPGRNWINLWKPTIDALGRILGHAPGARPWAPLDGRVVDLGLHRGVDPMMGSEVVIAIAAQRVRPRLP